MSTTGEFHATPSLDQRTRDELCATPTRLVSRPMPRRALTDELGGRGSSDAVPAGPSPHHDRDRRPSAAAAAAAASVTGIARRALLSSSPFIQMSPPPRRCAPASAARCWAKIKINFAPDSIQIASRFSVIRAI